MPADIREIILADGHSVNAPVRVAPRLSYPHINGASNPNACHDGLLVLRTMVYERLAARHPRSLLNMRSQAAQDVAISNWSHEPAYGRHMSDGNR